jgi:hypothetical protein
MEETKMLKFETGKKYGTGTTEVLIDRRTLTYSPRINPGDSGVLTTNADQSRTYNVSPKSRCPYSKTAGTSETLP